MQITSHRKTSFKKYTGNKNIIIKEDKRSAVVILNKIYITEKKSKKY